jgi:Cdc6-like AAA superfamily ATPase
MAAAAPLYADREYGRARGADCRCPTARPSTASGLTDDHLAPHSNFHHLDGRDLLKWIGRTAMAKETRQIRWIGPLQSYCAPARLLPTVVWGARLTLGAAVDGLSTKVEEAARSTKEGVRYFIEPAPGTLRRAVAKRHHIVFGRRGSGKSSLIQKAAADLTVDRRPIAVVNLESFKSHSYPDVLLSVLISTFEEFQKWLETAGINPATKTSFWKKLFGSAPSRPALNKVECEDLSKKIAQQISRLIDQLHVSDDSNLKITRDTRKDVSAETRIAGGIETSSSAIKAKVEKDSKRSETGSQGESVQEEFKRKKIDFLHQHIMEYQRIFREMARVSGGDSYLFLDDLYQIRRADQANLVDYFHRVAKDNHLWLKCGTIRHRSDWYRLGNPPIGVKLGDDADEIDLDVTLEKYQIAKNFLMSILKKFAEERAVDLDQLLTDGAQERLVLASGGVARDFLAIFRKSIDLCRERDSDRISAEDVNEAAGEYEPSKREDFKRDSAEDAAKLDEVFRELIDFCLRDNNTNCFLVDKVARGEKIDLLHELVDLKLLHLVRSRVTVPRRSGDIFEAYMLDFSQYSGARKRRGLQTIEFWKADSDDKLRKVSLIYADAR